MSYLCPSFRGQTLLGCCVLMAALGCRINFETTDADPATIIDADPATIIDADPATIIDADPLAIVDAGAVSSVDAFVGPDATPTVASLRLVGSTSCEGPSSVITVPAAGVEVGSVVLVHAYRRASTGGVTASDSRGNSYSQLLVSGDNGTRMHLWHATVTTALVEGDTITLTESNPKPSAVVVVELRNANPTPFATVTGGADGTAISMNFTATSPGVVLCLGANRGGPIQLEAGWSELVNLAADCGGTQGDVSSFAEWIPAGKDGISNCAGSFSFPLGFEQWVGSVISYGE